MLFWPQHCFTIAQDGARNLQQIYIYTLYDRKFWRGINFGRLAVLRANYQYFHPPNCCSMMSSLRTCYYVASSTCGPLSFKMSAQKLQTLKESNKNSPDLVYHQLLPLQFNVPAVFTLLITIPVCCYEYNNVIMVLGLPSCQHKICHIPLLEQSAKYSSYQNFPSYGIHT